MELNQFIARIKEEVGKLVIEAHAANEMPDEPTVVVEDPMTKGQRVCRIVGIRYDKDTNQIVLVPSISGS